MTVHPAIAPGNVALITGGASGIGLAIATRLAAAGMKLVLIDNRADALARAVAGLSETEVMDVTADVSDRSALESVFEKVKDRFGGVDVLVNNAGIEPPNDVFSPVDVWHKVLGVNLWGVINGCQVFIPDMLSRARPGLVINTGSKQGITTPPGNPAYNVSKSALKSYTEALEHQMRNTDRARINVHLLIPGFVFTDLTAGDRTEKPDAVQAASGFSVRSPAVRSVNTNPDAAWTADQTADFMIDSIARGDFYILCPDNDVPRRMDEKRMAWAMGDIIENRPPLSRWHSDWTKAFEAFLDRD